MPRSIDDSRDVASAVAGSMPLPSQTDSQEQRKSEGWASLPPDYGFPEVAPTLAEAQQYCQRLATSHYENFSVVTWFLPERLHRHFYSIYAYCRISDDLGDEVGNAEQSLRLLDEWEAELDRTYASLESPAAAQFCASGKAGGEEARGRGSKSPGSPANCGLPRHPVFVALRETIRECGIPKKPFADLLKAFRQDQTVTRYDTFQDLLGYCQYSANPVGRLVLYACGYSDERRQELSDFTCTALQLANFWQDVAIDVDKGRIYLPLEDLHKFGVSEDDIARRRCTPKFAELMTFEVARAREWFKRGLPLASMVERHLAIDLELFTRGGQAILDAIEGQGYDVLRARPAIPRWRKLWLVARAAVRLKLGR
jgi:squalene synthase HpnC